MIIIDIFKKNAEIFFRLNFVTLVALLFFLVVSILNIINDLKNKKVFSIFLFFSSLAFLAFWGFYDINIFWVCLIGYVGVIVVFLCIFFISKEGIGLGDMLYLGFFASLYGYFFSIIAFFLSFWIATAILIIPFFLKKIDKKTKIPFIPFLFIGCFITILTGFIVHCKF